MNKLTNNTKYKILLVEDLWLDIEYARKPLERTGRYEVIVAQDREEAVKKLKNEGPFDVVLVDLKLPNKEGLLDRNEGKEVLKTLSESGTSPWVIISNISKVDFYEVGSETSNKVETPCCAVISSLPEGTGLKVWNECYTYIEKPYNPAYLVKVLNEIVEKRTRRDTEANADGF